MELKSKQTTSYKDKVIKFLESKPDTKKPYTQFEDDIIRKYYYKKGSKAIAQALDRTRPAITARALRLGLSGGNDEI